MPDDRGGGARDSQTLAVSVETTTDLLARARQGDAAAIERLFARHLKPLQRFARGRLPGWARELADTDDLVQDALLKTFKRIDAFESRHPGALQAYLRQAVAFSTLQQLGRLAEAEQLLREAARIDPLAAEVQLALGRVLVQANRPSEAIVVLERVRGAESVLPLVDLQLGRALALDGRLEESLPLLERRRERLVEPAGGPHPWVAFAYVKLGRRADAERLAREDDRLPFRRAIINAALGDTDRMFNGLHEMADREPHRLVLLLRAPEFAPYRQDERFTRLLRRVKLD